MSRPSRRPEIEIVETPPPVVAPIPVTPIPTIDPDELARLGADVVVVSRTEAELDEVVREIARAGRRGLAIAAELVRAHDGDIHLVEGTLGATFRIVIPDRPVELLSIRNERARA